MTLAEQSMIVSPNASADLYFNQNGVAAAIRAAL